MLVGWRRVPACAGFFFAGAFFFACFASASDFRWMSRWRSTVFFAAPVLPAFFVAIETSPLQGSPRRYRRRRGRTVEAACSRRRTTIRATPPQGALRGAAHQPALRDALLVALAVFSFVPFAELLPAVFFA